MPRGRAPADGREPDARAPGASPPGQGGAAPSAGRPRWLRRPPHAVGAQSSTSWTGRSALAVDDRHPHCWRGTWAGRARNHPRRHARHERLPLAGWPHRLVCVSDWSCRGPTRNVGARAARRASLWRTNTLPCAPRRRPAPAAARCGEVRRLHDLLFRIRANGQLVPVLNGQTPTAEATDIAILLGPAQLDSPRRRSCP
jgi:hypothetical protein